MAVERNMIGTINYLDQTLVSEDVPVTPKNIYFYFGLTYHMRIRSED